MNRALSPRELAIIAQAKNAIGFQLGDLLDYLAKNQGDSELARRARSAQAIKEQVFSGRGVIVSAKVAELRKKLSEYFSNHPEHSLRISIKGADESGRATKDLYKLLFSRNWGDGDYTRAFWRPHLNEDVETLIVYGEPLFGSDHNHELFTRNVLVNEDQTLADEQHPSYTFVALGEVEALWRLTKWFTNQGVPVEAMGCRHTYDRKAMLSSDPSATSNLVLIGTPRANGVLRDYLDDHPHFRFRVNNKTTIEYKDGVEHERQDERDPTSKTGKITYAVVSRRSGFQSGAITIIASHWGRAAERIAQSLTNEKDLRKLFEDGKIPLVAGELPEEFQILISVQVHEKDSGAGRCRVIDWWAPKQSI